MTVKKPTLNYTKALELTLEGIAGKTDQQLVEQYKLGLTTVRRYYRQVLNSLAQHDPDKPETFSERYRWQNDNWLMSVLRKTPAQSKAKILAILDVYPKAHHYRNKPKTNLS